MQEPYVIDTDEGLVIPDPDMPPPTVCLTPIEREAAWQKWFSSGRPSEMLVDVTTGKAWTMETIKEAFLAGIGAAKG